MSCTCLNPLWRCGDQPLYIPFSSSPERNCALTDQCVGATWLERTPLAPLILHPRSATTSQSAAEGNEDKKKVLSTSSSQRMSSDNPVSADLERPLCNVRTAEPVSARWRFQPVIVLSHSCPNTIAVTVNVTVYSQRWGEIKETLQILHDCFS